MDSDQLEEVMVAVLNHYDLPVPGSGERNMRCPVHEERVASASMNVNKGLWHCHACGAGGTAVNIVMAREQLDYKQALAFITERVGKELKQTKRTARGRATSNGRWVPPRLRRGA
jgi:DNA primase